MDINRFITKDGFMIAIKEVVLEFWCLFIEVSGYYTLAARWIFLLLAVSFFTVRIAVFTGQKEKRYGGT